MNRDQIIAQIEQEIYDAVAEAVGKLILSEDVSEEYGERIIDEYTLQIPEE